MKKLRTIDEVRDLVTKVLKKQGSTRLVFVGQRATDALIFDNLMWPLSGVICLDDGLDADELRRHMEVTSYESRVKERRLWYSTQLGAMIEDPIFFAKIIDLCTGSLVLPYASCTQLERIAVQCGAKILGPTAKLRMKFENKLALHGIRKDLGLPNQSLIISVHAMPSFSELTRSLRSTSLVLQRGDGSSGSGTWFIHSQEELDAVMVGIGGNEHVVVSTCVGGPTISVNGVVTKNHVLINSPAIQIVNEPTLSSRFGVFSGVDFCASWQLTHLEKTTIVEISKKVGCYLQANGYYGAFNVNIMLEGMLLTDLNARWMGSGQFMTDNQIANSQIPFSWLQILTFLDEDFHVDGDMEYSYLDQMYGSMIVSHLVSDLSCRITGVVEPGAYTCEGLLCKGGKPISQRLLKEYKENVFVVSGGIPRLGTLVYPNAPVYRVYTRESVLDGQLLSDRWQGIVNVLNHKLGFKPKESV